MEKDTGQLKWWDNDNLRIYFRGDEYGGSSDLVTTETVEMWDNRDSANVYTGIQIRMQHRCGTAKKEMWDNGDGRFGKSRWHR